MAAASPVDAARPTRDPGAGWRAAGLRPVLTLLSTGLVALVSALLLWLGWLLVGGVANAVPALPPGSRVRVGGLDVPAEQVSAAVGAAMQAEVLRAGLIAYPLVVLAAAVVSWWLVGRVLGPLHAVTATARRLSAESLDTRLGLRDARGEVAELAAGFDAMLDRLQAAFDAQRRFVANASHELRTPLAVLRTEVDVTLADPDADVDELRRMGEVVREATRRADELIAGLLLLARSEAPSAVDPAAVRTVDLADVVVPAARRDARRGRPPRAADHASTVAPAPTVGDPVLLERVAGNLVENAVRHNVAAGWVEDRHRVCGPGRPSCASARAARRSPPDRVEELFEPFRRGPVDRTADTPGSGLGLSIVRAVVHAHGGHGGGRAGAGRRAGGHRAPADAVTAQRASRRSVACRRSRSAGRQRREELVVAALQHGGGRGAEPVAARGSGPAPARGCRPAQDDGPPARVPPTTAPPWPWSSGPCRGRRRARAGGRPVRSPAVRATRTRGPAGSARPAPPRPPAAPAVARAASRSRRVPVRVSGSSIRSSAL